MAAHAILRYVEFFLSKEGYVCPVYVCHLPIICLSVCLLATSHRTTDWILMNFFPEQYLWTRKNGLNFGKLLTAFGSGSRNFEGFYQIVTCEIGLFSTI